MKITATLLALSSALFCAELTFSPLELTKTDQELMHPRVSKSAQIGDKHYKLEYKKLLYTSEKLEGAPYPFGTLVDKEMHPMLWADGSLQISTSVDSNSILRAGERKYLITHLEASPGALYATRLDVKDDAIVPLSTEPLDFSSVGGTLINCAGSTSPWNTHLGGEEDYSLNSRYADIHSPFYVACEQKEQLFTGKSEAGAQNYFCAYVASMQAYLKDKSIDKAKGYNGESFTPYNYGYIIEAGIDEKGKSEVAKHYVTGKYTPELSVVMPDQKTLYMSDDGNGKGLYKFVSDKKIEKFEKNWSGTLYIAKVTQKNKKDAGEFSLSWVELGHSSDDEILSVINENIVLSDIFDIAPLEQKQCKDGFRKIFEDGVSYCLRLKEANSSAKFKDKQTLLRAAAFLETRKYGAYLGGTTEFVKEEGLTYDKDRNVMYLAMSSIKEAMLDNYEGQESNNAIRQDKNVCGAVYELSLDDSFSATQMHTVLAGKELNPKEKESDTYRCSPSFVSNPDNILYIGDNTLLIGEDTQYHVTNMLWAYNTHNKKLTRIATLPIGGEVTGLSSVQIKDKKVIFFNVQHPFEDIPVNAAKQDIKADLIHHATPEQKNGFIGYIDFIE